MGAAIYRMEGPQKMKHTTTIWSSNPVLGKMKTLIQRDIRSPSSLQLIYSSEVMSTDGGMDKDIVVHVCTMEYHSAMKTEGTLPPVTT